MAPTDDEERARDMREALVADLVRQGEAHSPRVIAALRAVPRHLFCPDVALEDAYANCPQAIGYEQTISQPAIVAIMTEALELTGSERVLEVGTGSGYQAAVLSALCREVFSIERIEALAAVASRRLAALGCGNVYVRAGDGHAGWPEEAPFDRVIVTAAPRELPRTLIEQLIEGGIVVAPIESRWSGDQSLLSGRKRGAELVVKDLGGVRFVAMVAGTRPS